MMLPILLALAAFVASSTQAALPAAKTPLTVSTEDQSVHGRATRAISPLTFDDNGNFQVAIFEDLHFGENAWDTWGPQQDINTVKVIDKVLDREFPNLVVFNGDLITGENAFLENSTDRIDQMVGPLLKRNLPWASTYGNHDYAYNVSGATILAREKNWPNCRTQRMVTGGSAGVSNYYLPVYAPDCSGPQCAPELLLWFFDSRGGAYYRERNAGGTPRAQPDWVDTSVVDWFQATSSSLSQSFGRTIPSLAFVHIPTFASQALQTEHGRDSIHPNYQPGINDDYPLAPQAKGWCSDGRNDGACAYGGQDVPFMKAIASTPGLIALFSGHDHGDSWCYKWDRLLPGMTVAGNGVNLCFGQRSGYGGYGHWIRGSRQVLVSRQKLRNSPEAETWIRLESGGYVGSVTLNDRYGKDLYPATPNDKTYCPTCDYSVITEREVKTETT